MEIETECPNCNGKGDVREIIYGMSTSDRDDDKYIFAGCVVILPEYEVGCKECGWRGFSTQAKQKTHEDFMKEVREMQNQPLTQEEIDRRKAIPKRSKIGKRLPSGGVIRVKRKS